jgi:hypothetical protein
VTDKHTKQVFAIVLVGDGEDTDNFVSILPKQLVHVDAEGALSDHGNLHGSAKKKKVN